MVGMAAAFFGDRLDDVKDARNQSGRCVADTYVLCNPPYSMLKKNPAESWTQGQVRDKDGRVGRQTPQARGKTLAAFFGIVRKQASPQQDVADIDRFMANEKRGFTAADDRGKYGYGPTSSTLGRVTLYCNPHDRVISAATMQGIGWRGMSQEEIDATKGAGTFSQRVFAQDFKVGEQGHYDYWANHYNKPERGGKEFWAPLSQPAEYSLNKGLDANATQFGKVMTVLMWPIMKLTMGLADTRINGVPPDSWRIPLTTPDLPLPFKPKSLRFGQESEQFDEGYDAPGASRNKAPDVPLDPADPYAPIPGSGEGAAQAKDAAKGDRDSEAALRYQDHALLRMKARRERMYKNNEKVKEEDDPQQAGAAYRKWRTDKIRTNLADNIDTHATDHSTIMTNGMHAQRALAYDVAVGVSYISQEDLTQLRKAADWRLLSGLEKNDPHKIFEQHFVKGKFMGVLLSEWAHTSGRAGTDGSMPKTIIDEREFAWLPRAQG